MIKLQHAFVQRVVGAQKLEDLHDMVQMAIELEHATIPPYLTAMFSLKPGTNREVWEVIHSIVLEEMLHMSIACNILNALGGSPSIDRPDFVPAYPGPLPMGIGEQLTVSLKGYSRDHVKNVFMEIEEPESPIEFPVRVLAMGDQVYSTIGQFYAALRDRIVALAAGALPGDPALQFTTSSFSPGELFPIITVDDAVRAIEVIVEQGEGTETSPLDGDGRTAHYYRFQELHVGRRLVEDTTSPKGFSFSGPAIAFSDDDVYNLFPDTKVSMLPDGSEERRLAELLAATYTKLLKGLDQTFNGNQAKFGDTISLMFDLKLIAERLCARDFPGIPGFKVGPSFEYVAVV